VAFLPENHALAIAIMSYNGQLNFGLLATSTRFPISQRSASTSPMSWPRCWRWRASPRPPPPERARSVAECELGVLAHQLGRPRRREDHLESIVFTPASSPTNSSICSVT